MAWLEVGRSFHDAIKCARPRDVGVVAHAPTSEFADIARFFRRQSIWELAQVKLSQKIILAFRYQRFDRLETLSKRNDRLPRGRRRWKNGFSRMVFGWTWSW
jgi:hypothetical protein